jgi:hypothetical protein
MAYHAYMITINGSAHLTLVMELASPNSPLESSFGEDLPAINSAGHPSKQILKKFWNGWWDRKLKTTEGKECWNS